MYPMWGWLVGAKGRPNLITILFCCALDLNTPWPGYKTTVGVGETTWDMFKVKMKPEKLSTAASIIKLLLFIKMNG